jgi:hypothetical protein
LATQGVRQRLGYDAIIMRARSTLGFATAAIIFAWHGSALAGLGEDVRAVQMDANALKSTVRTTSLVQYDVHEISSAEGVTVREFVSRGGAVFALSWSGPVPPDLQQLLGRYFAAYVASLNTLDHPGLRRSVRVVTPELTVELSGHMRAYIGRAYLPSLIPDGIGLAELR